MSVASAARKRGNWWALAPMESLGASLKKNQAHQQHYKARAEVRADIFDYIETIYNTIRRHSALGNLPDGFHSAIR